MTIPVFKAAAADVAQDPILFHIDGDPLPFSVARPVPGFPVLALAVEAMVPEQNEQAALAAFYRFLRACIGEGQWPRFSDAVTRARFGVDDLVQIVQHITSEATGRPSMPSSDAPPSSPATGRPSKGARSRTADATRKG